MQSWLRVRQRGDRRISISSNTSNDMLRQILLRDTGETSNWPDHTTRPRVFPNTPQICGCLPKTQQWSFYPWWLLCFLASWLIDKARPTSTFSLSSLSRTQDKPHIPLLLSSPHPGSCAHTSWESRASRTPVVFEFTCSGERRQSPFWEVSAGGTTTRFDTVRCNGRKKQ